ncbi:MAG: SoxR reducing system RseC family protein [Candidatus Brocadiia bacterium]
MGTAMHGCPIEDEGRRGTVVDVQGDQAVVELSAGGACGSEAGCEHCSLFSVQAPQVLVPRDGLDKGDRVRVRPPERSGYLSMTFLFVLPPLFAIVGFMVGGSLVNGGAIGTVAAIGGGVLGLAVAAAIATAVNRKFETTARFRVERL